MGGDQGDAARVFIVVHGERARGSGQKLKHDIQAGDKEKTPTMRIIKQWNGQPTEIEMSVLGSFQTWLDKALSNLARMHC